MWGGTRASESFLKRDHFDVVKHQIKMRNPAWACVLQSKESSQNIFLLILLMGGEKMWARKNYRKSTCIYAFVDRTWEFTESCNTRIDAFLILGPLQFPQSFEVTIVKQIREDVVKRVVKNADVVSCVCHASTESLTATTCAVAGVILRGGLKCFCTRMLLMMKSEIYFNFHRYTR